MTKFQVNAMQSLNDISVRGAVLNAQRGNAQEWFGFCEAQNAGSQSVIARSLISWWALCDPLCNRVAPADIDCSPVFLTSQIITCAHFQRREEASRVRRPGKRGVDPEIRKKLLEEFWQSN